MPGCGARSGSGPSSSRRSTPSRRRISASACRPVARDRGQRLPGPLRVGVQRVRGAVRLHHHHADVVRDHVVQFAGDPGPLGRRGDLRLGVPLALQPGRPVLQAGVVRPPVAHRVAEHPGDQRRRRRTRSSRQRSPFQHAGWSGIQPTTRHRRAGQADGQPGRPRSAAAGRRPACTAARRWPRRWRTAGWSAPCSPPPATPVQNAAAGCLRRNDHRHGQQERQRDPPSGRCP